MCKCLKGINTLAYFALFVEITGIKRFIEYDSGGYFNNGPDYNRGFTTFGRKTNCRKSFGEQLFSQ